MQHTIPCTRMTFLIRFFIRQRIWSRHVPIESTKTQAQTQTQTDPWSMLIILYSVRLKKTQTATQMQAQTQTDLWSVSLITFRWIYVVMVCASVVASVVMALAALAATKIWMIVAIVTACEYVLAIKPGSWFWELEDSDKTDYILLSSDVINHTLHVIN